MTCNLTRLRPCLRHLARATKSADPGPRRPVHQGLGVLVLMLRDDACLVCDASCVASGLLEVLLVILNNLGGDFVPKVILLGRSLRSRSRRGKGHCCAAPVGNEIRGGRDTGRPARRLEKGVIPCFGRGGGVAVIALGGREARIPSTTTP